MAATAAQAGGTLDPPDHPMHFGYYFVDGRHGDLASEVNCYTNLYVAWARRGYECSAESPNSQWLPLMRDGMCRAAVQGRDIYLSLNLQEENPARVTPLDAVLQAAAPFWSRVQYIEVADEPAWDLQETEAKLQLVLARLSALGLPLPPKGLGIVYADEPSLGAAFIGATQGIYAPSLDWVGIEAYIAHGVSSTPRQTLIDQVSGWMERVGHDKNVVLVMMAYAPGVTGGWANDIPTLTTLQTVPYELGFEDDRVLAITMFAYGRPRGTRELFPIQQPHLEIGEQILGAPLPPGCGEIVGPQPGLCSPFDDLPPECQTAAVSIGDAALTEGDGETRSLTFASRSRTPPAWTSWWTWLPWAARPRPEWITSRWPCG
jgi:hypothetical protein